MCEYLQYLANISELIHLRRTSIDKETDYDLIRHHFARTQVNITKRFAARSKKGLGRGKTKLEAAVTTLSASCCALGEATRGHNAVSSLVHAAAQQCDHTSEMEVPGLIPGTDLRPADVLTSALGNAYTALDVSICSPHALEAGTDLWPPPGCPPSPEHFLHPDRVECLWATSPRHVDRFALSQ